MNNLINEYDGELNTDINLLGDDFYLYTSEEYKKIYREKYPKHC